MDELNRTVIPAISQMKNFERCLESDLTYCVLMDIHLELLNHMVKAAHAKGKKVLFHMDLMQGLANDEFGCEYACQVLKADGVISTKAKVLSAARKNHCLAILRMFLIDTKSLNKGIVVCDSVQPDYVEILPGCSCVMLPKLREQIKAKIMCGGLISNAEEISYCFQMGAYAVTVSDWKAVKEYLEKQEDGKN